MKNLSYQLKRRSSELLFFGAGLVLLASALLPLAFPNNADAAQITSRSLTISSGIPSDTGVTYTFTFTIPSTSAVQGLKFKACTTATGTYSGGSCTAPTTLDFSSAVFDSQSGWQGATNFAVDGTGANDCTPAANVLCANRTDATAQTATSRTIAFNTITNPSTANTAFFVGISTYSTSNYTASATDTGTTASAVVQTLTINAAVAEILNFCVGSTTVDDATTSVASDCTGVSGTSVNMGTLDSSNTNVTPVNTNGGDNKNGVAMLRTNAVNGATISYDAIQQSGSNHLGTLRISGATCNAGSVSTDQCIDAQGATQAVFNASTDTSEKFGITIAGVNCGSTTSYTCTFSSGTYNLVRDAAYDGNGANTFVSDAGSVSGATNGGYAWVEDGTVTEIASSSTVVDDEALILKFAAHPMITTPFGSYTAQSDFIAVPTY